MPGRGEGSSRAMLATARPSCNCILYVFLLFLPIAVNKDKKHLKNVGPIRHCEPPHCHSPGVASVARRHCRTPPAHQCPQQQRQPRQRVTEVTAMAPLNGPKNTEKHTKHTTTIN